MSLYLTTLSQASRRLQRAPLSDPLNNEFGLLSRTDNVQWISNFWNFFEAGHVHCLAWVGFFDVLTHVIHQEANFTFVCT